jgi:hypothetical protein
MPDPHSSGAMVPLGAGSASFAQQGSLDWVALANTQYSASIAVLGRLAKAGIDPLTVAFGQAMCMKLPIGVHGERVLAEAMSTLSAKSCAADLLWFGTGIRHILRDLVQTSQGCSLVALCAALTESHPMSLSALVLYDIAKQIGGPQEIQPSFEQWEALVRATASVFNATTFGLRVHQIAKFATSPQIQPNGQRTMFRDINQRPDIPHPTDLAKVLLSIGQIVQGSLHAVSVQGSCCCSWIAAWGDYVLGLRVLVRDTNGSIVFANFNAMEASAQISVTFVDETPDNNTIWVQTSHSIRSGVEFVRNCFSKQGITESRDNVFQSGRLNWETMWQASFGHSFSPLVQLAKNEDPETPQDSAFELSSDEVTDDFMSVHKIFARLVAIATIILFTEGPISSYYGTVQFYSSYMCGIIPELRPCKEQIRLAIEATLKLLSADDPLDRCTSAAFSAMDTLILEYVRYQHLLAARCGCESHKRFENQITAQFCLSRLTETMIYVMYMLDRVVFDSPLQPTVYGMHRIYSASAKDLVPNHRGVVNVRQLIDPLRRLTRSIDDGSGAMFADLAALFAGQDWQIDLQGSVAQSDGKLYCYNQLLEELTDNIRDATRIHVGSGHMTYRMHRVLYDTSGHREHQPGYPASTTELVSSVDCLTEDTASNPIDSEIVVVETPTHIYLRHQITTKLGQFWISPTLLLNRLHAAMAYHSRERIPSSDNARWGAVLQGHTYIKVQGEGLVDTPNECHMLRPLHGNILGRCVAIATTKSPVALVRSRQDLEVFARYWCRDFDVRQEDGLGLRYFVLIS